MLCTYELILSGKNEYWDEMNRYGRNQLSENQVRYTGYVEVDNTKEDADGKTYKNLDKRLVGGYTGGSEPNSISLTRFRSIAGCCVGTGPIALELLWNNVAIDIDGVLTVNIHTDKETDDYTLTHYMPDEGRIALTVKKYVKAGFRLYTWMSEEWTLLVNGEKVDALFAENGEVAYASLKTGDTVELVFPIATVEKKEFFAGREYTEYWRGGDMIDILPRGEHVRLYQRDNKITKYYPLPSDIVYTGPTQKGPTQQTTIVDKK